MEEIKNILGLRIHQHGHLEDKFGNAFINALHLPLVKIFGPEGLCVEDEVGPLERRKEILDGDEDKAYEKALRLLAKIRPEYKKYLLRIKYFGLSDLLKRKIRLAVWVGTGNKIPFRELNTIKVLNLLKGEGYTYRRDELRWYHGNLLVAKDLYGALEHLEKHEPVNRGQLTIQF